MGGLLRGMAKTAAVAGTAQATRNVSTAMRRREMLRRIQKLSSRFKDNPSNTRSRHHHQQPQRRPHRKMILSRSWSVWAR